MESSHQGDENQEALNHHRNFASTIESINSTIACLPDGWEKNKLSQDVQQLYGAADGLSKFLSARIPPIHYNEIRSEDSQIAERVFLIPELLELILSHDHVSVRDLLIMRQVSKGVQAIIDASPKLQVKLCYRAIDHRTAVEGHTQHHSDGTSTRVLSMPVSAWT